jgi:hypothetical protein
MQYGMQHSYGMPQHSQYGMSSQQSQYSAQQYYKSGSSNNSSPPFSAQSHYGGGASGYKQHNDQSKMQYRPQQSDKK